MRYTLIMTTPVSSDDSQIFAVAVYTGEADSLLEVQQLHRDHNPLAKTVRSIAVGDVVVVHGRGVELQDCAVWVLSPNGWQRMLGVGVSSFAWLAVRGAPAHGTIDSLAGYKAALRQGSPAVRSAG